MGAEPVLAIDVGLRHVLEDGVALLSRGGLQPARRQFVVDDLVQLLREAVRGSELLDRTSLLVASADRSAVETFALIDRYLRSGQDNTLRDDLKVSAGTFGALQEGKEIDAQQKKRALRFLRHVLNTLERSDSSGLLERPDDTTVGQVNN